MVNEIIVDPDAFDDPTEDILERFDNILLEQGDGDILVLMERTQTQLMLEMQYCLNTFDENKH